MLLFALTFIYKDTVSFYLWIQIIIFQSIDVIFRYVKKNILNNLIVFSFSILDTMIRCKLTIYMHFIIGFYVKLIATSTFLLLNKTSFLYVIKLNSSSSVYVHMVPFTSVSKKI